MRVQSLVGERSPGEGNGNALQYSYLENPTDRGAWWAAVSGAAKCNLTEHTYTYIIWSCSIYIVCNFIV